MVDCQHSKGKRRRSGHVDERSPAKKSRYDGIEQCSTNSISEVENKDGHKRRRARKRTKGLRELIKNKIEVALRSTSSPLSPLFTTVDSAGTPQAAFIEVIKSIGLSQEYWLKAASLSPRAAESISNITNMFRIERNSDNKLMLKYRAAEWSIEDCTVYLDNLPAGCTTEKIRRIARKFGTVVEVRLPKSSSRQVHSSYGVLEMGKHSRSFAFLQFTEPEACRSMCDAFLHNAPGSAESSEKNQSLVPLLQRLLLQIRILSRRRRRRTYAQNVLLMRLRRQQAAIIRKERAANKRTAKMSREVNREKTVATTSQRKNGESTTERHSVDGELNASSSESGERRRLSFGKKKKAKARRSTSEAMDVGKKRRRRRRKRKNGLGPHSIHGSLNDYFEKMQVFPFATYVELRKEYVALRRKSDSQTSMMVKNDKHFKEFASRLCGGKIVHKLETYRDCHWSADVVQEER